MVNTSCCVVTNEMVLCSWNFHATNHDEMNRVLLVVFNIFIIICFIICSELHSISELYNKSVLYNSSEFQYHKVYNTQFISSQVLLNYLNGASLQDSSLLRYTLYTSSVQDLHLPPRLLLQRQCHAYCQGQCLRAIK